MGKIYLYLDAFAVIGVSKFKSTSLIRNFVRWNLNNKICHWMGFPLIETPSEHTPKLGKPEAREDFGGFRKGRQTCEG